MSYQPEANLLADAREETWRLLGALAHYCRCAQMHLQVADDPVTIHDLAAVQEYFLAATRAFVPVRAAIKACAPRTENARE